MVFAEVPITSSTAEIMPHTVHMAEAANGCMVMGTVNYIVMERDMFTGKAGNYPMVHSFHFKRMLRVPPENVR